MIIFKITAFMCAICFLLLGTFIAYYKSVIKVDTMIQQRRTTFICYTAFSVIGVFHSAFVIFFAISEDVVISDGETYDPNRLSSKQQASMFVSIAIQVIFYFLELLAFIVTYRKVNLALDTMLKFHDYLIEYRLTPRSRILRKHLPKMTMVLEEESNMDYSRSSIMISQSRLMSQHTFTSKKRSKFVYRDETAADPNQRQQSADNEDISDCSESTDSQDEDLETSLMVFDKEQAEIIRHINRMGSSCLPDGQKNMNFLSSSLSPGQNLRRTQVDQVQVKNLSASGH